MPQSSPSQIFSIEPFSESDLPKLKQFTDQAIGEGYYSDEELRDIFKRSFGPGAGSGGGSAGEPKMCSLLLKSKAASGASPDDSEILGVRFTYPPGNWNHGKGRGLNPEKWPHALKDTAYFQSLFLSEKIQGQGWGSKLSEASIAVLKSIGAKGVVCHSWKESPGNSSSKYLLKMGFKPLAEHPLYWSEVDYNCTRCLKPPCQCTAIEMYYEI